jgi:hypothetical protein
MELSREDVADTIETFVSGMGAESDWDDFISIPIKDPELESIRIRCALMRDEFPPTHPRDFCSDAGLETMRRIAAGLRANPSSKPPENSNVDSFEWLEWLLPRNPPKSLFLFVMACYALTLGRLEMLLIQLGRRWLTAGPYRSLQHSYPNDPLGRQLFDLLLLGPVIESFILVAVLELCRRLKLGVAIQVAVPAAILCLMHTSRAFPFWGLIVAPLFLADAATYLFWRRRSVWVGMMMAILLHFFCNAFAGIATIIDSLHQ